MDNRVKQCTAVKPEAFCRIAITAAESQCRAVNAHIAVIKAIGKKKIALIFRGESN